MIRVRALFLLLYAAASLIGCQTGSRQSAQTTHLLSDWTEDGRSGKFVREGTSASSVRFASRRATTSSQSTFSRFLDGGGNRIPLPAASEATAHQIDPPRQASANSIGAF